MVEEQAQQQQQEGDISKTSSKNTDKGDIVKMPAPSDPATAAAALAAAAYMIRVIIYAAAASAEIWKMSKIWNEKIDVRRERAHWFDKPAWWSREEET